MTWEDRGTYWFDTEAKFRPMYDDDGNFIGGYYCPYIPKSICPERPVEQEKVDGLDAAVKKARGGDAPPKGPTGYA